MAPSLNIQKISQCFICTALTTLDQNAGFDKGSVEIDVSESDSQLEDISSKSDRKMDLANRNGIFYDILEIQIV